MYDFNTSGQGNFLPNLIELQIFLNSQQEQEVVSNEFLVQLQSNLKDQPAKLNKLMHFYMSYACKFGYHKQVKDKLDESFH